MNLTKFGLKPETIEKLISVFEKNGMVDQVLIYGSRAKGNYRDGSDIDITLVGGRLSITDLLRIENEIEELLLPYKVDLSILSKIEDPDLLDHINRIGVELYKRDLSQPE